MEIKILGLRRIFIERQIAVVATKFTYQKVLLTHNNARLLRVHFEFVLFESERGEPSGRASLVKIGQAVAVGFRFVHEYGAIDGNVGLGAGRH